MMNTIFLSIVLLTKLHWQRRCRYYYICDSAHCNDYVQHCFDAETAGRSQYLSTDILRLLSSQVIRPCIAPHTFLRFITIRIAGEGECRFRLWSVDRESFVRCFMKSSEARRFANREARKAALPTARWSFMVQLSFHASSSSFPTRIITFGITYVRTYVPITRYYRRKRDKRSRRAHRRLKIIMRSWPIDSLMRLTRTIKCMKIV